jgi:carboxylesterase type B
MRMQAAVLALGTTLATVSPYKHLLTDQPLAETCNGTYTGVYSPGYNQDFFLGVPYAQAPVNDLRFRNPRPLTSSWKGNRRADTYSPACVGYGPSQAGYDVSEDCLYLNIVRPSGIDAGANLPVAVWIHGGGWVQGSGVDLRYNMSFIVQQSQQQGQPIVAVTLNYRLSAWGFLQGYANAGNGSSLDAGSNWGLRDQRLALHWMQENICAFGGQHQPCQGMTSSLLIVRQVILPKSLSGVSRLVLLQSAYI